jgi:hypothetical protein
MQKTYQEVFDFVVERLLQQGKRAMRKSGGETLCALRGEGNTKCAIGHLIPDEDYTAELEDFSTIHNIEGENSLSRGMRKVLEKNLGEITEEDAIFLHEFQFAHDVQEEGRSLRETMRLFAKAYNLDTKVLDTNPGKEQHMIIIGTEQTPTTEYPAQIVEAAKLVVTANTQGGYDILKDELGVMQHINDTCGAIDMLDLKRNIGVYL